MLDDFHLTLEALPPLPPELLLGIIFLLGILVCFLLTEVRLSRWKRRCRALQLDKALLAERLNLEQQHHREKAELLERAGTELQVRFRELANEIFEEKSLRFSTRNSRELESLLQPFRDQLTSFQNRVDTIFHEDTRERASLKQEVLQLQRLNQQINEEARNLAEAITGNRKLQGTWGEMVLERLLEESGLRRGHEYDTQAGLRDHKNRLFKPDVIIHLPEGRNLVIDSKVSLSAWLRYLQAEDENDRTQALKEHLQALKTHLAELGSKDYGSLRGLQSLEFVLMFVPIEAAFITALQFEEKLLTEMHRRRIIIVTPTTLMATLKTIEHIWRLERQNQNSLEIAERAGKLHDKLCGFLEDLEKLGRQLDTCRDTYDRAMNKISQGRNNLIRQAGSFSELGVPTRKEIPAALAQETETDNPQQETERQP